MRLTCPACGATGSLEFFLMDAAARACVVEALALPAPLAGQVMAYLGLFRPAKRGLTWDRAERLLAELVPAIRSAQVTHKGQTYAAPLEYWQAAIEQMLAGRAGLRLPLDNHNYLYSVVAGKSATASGAAERAEEQTKQYRYHRASSGELKPAAAVVDKEKGQRQARALRDSLHGNNKS